VLTPFMSVGSEVYAAVQIRVACSQPRPRRGVRTSLIKVGSYKPACRSKMRNNVHCASLAGMSPDPGAG